MKNSKSKKKKIKLESENSEKKLPKKKMTEEFTKDFLIDSVKPCSKEKISLKKKGFKEDPFEKLDHRHSEDWLLNYSSPNNHTTNDIKKEVISDMSRIVNEKEKKNANNEKILKNGKSSPASQSLKRKLPCKNQKVKKDSEKNKESNKNPNEEKEKEEEKIEFFGNDKNKYEE